MKKNYKNIAGLLLGTILGAPVMFLSFFISFAVIGEMSHNINGLIISGFFAFIIMVTIGVPCFTVGYGIGYGIIALSNKIKKQHV